MKKFCVLLLVLFIPYLSAHAQTETPSTEPVTTVPVDQRPQPGNTGAHAFSFIDPATDAQIGDHIILDVRVDGGKDKLGNFQGGMFRVKIPFAAWVEIEANAVTDAWQITEAVRARYNLRSTHSTRIDGDLNFSTKIRILKETEKRPAVSFQAVVKTAAGDFVGGHRYTDSAGYKFSALAAKDVYTADEQHDEAFIRKVRFLAELGFIAWDTNVAQQNDSYLTSAAIQIVGKNNLNMKVSFLGYYGWQSKSQDFVSSLQLEASKTLKKNPNLQFYGQTSIGLSKAATPLLLGAGMRVFLRAPQKKKRTFI